MLTRSSITIVILGTCTFLSAQEASERTPADLERSLVVSGQGYFPVAVRLRDGRIAVVLRGGAGHLGIKGRLDMVFSSDGGKTWEEPRPIDVADIGWGSPYGKILTQPDGAMLMALYGGPVRAPGEKVA